MVEKILSQAEVDALLRGIKGGEVDTRVSQASSSGVRLYDLTSQERIIRGRMPTLEIINERFARLFRLSISSFLRREVEFTPTSVEVAKFGEFMQRIPLPSSINILTAEPLQGLVLFVMDAQLIYLLLDFCFGGRGQTHVKAEGKDFTPIEQRFIRKLVDQFTGDLEKAWQPVHPLKVAFVRAEVNPQFAMVVVPTEVAITIAFKLEVENQSREMSLCFPYPAIEPIREKLRAGFQSDHLEVDKNWTERFKSQLGSCGVSLTAELGAAFLTLREVLNLREGDILLLDKGPEDDLMLKVEGRSKFRGRVGMYRSRRAFQITSQIRTQEEAGYGE